MPCRMPFIKHLLESVVIQAVKFAAKFGQEWWQVTWVHEEEIALTFLCLRLVPEFG